MSYLDKLLEGVEKEWATLGDVINLEKGKQLNKELLSENGLYPAYNGGVSFSGFTNFYNYNENTIIISQGGASAGFVNFVTTKFYANAHCYIILPNINKVENRFIYHFLKLNQEKLMTKQHGAGIPALSTKKILEIPIPIPPLAVQKEIVRILDKFTTLTAELQAELQARKKQYEYYRNELLHFEEGEVEWKTLGEVFDLKNGYTPSKANPEYWKNGTIPWFRMEDIRENGRVLNKSIQYVIFCAIKGSKLFPANSIIVATSATIGEHALITVPFLSNQRFINLSLKGEYSNKFLIKFLFYYGFILNEWCKNNVKVGNFAGVDMNGFKKFSIPVPSLEEQARIVSILDKFDTLTTSISEGLPKEIELRQKQYEYYRDMLLTFPS
jgi:type I restriction enzyme S subunit